VRFHVTRSVIRSPRTSSNGAMTSAPPGPSVAFDQSPRF
jgi:hypothetical protein